MKYGAVPAVIQKQQNFDLHLVLCNSLYQDKEAPQQAGAGDAMIARKRIAWKPAILGKRSKPMGAITMTTGEFYSELDSILGLKRGTTTGSESLSSLTGWDSMARILFIQLADDLGVDVPAEALLSCQRTSDLISLCNGRVTA